jgi:hypothetical protein
MICTEVLQHWPLWRSFVFTVFNSMMTTSKSALRNQWYVCNSKAPVLSAKFVPQTLDTARHFDTILLYATCGKSKDASWRPSSKLWYKETKLKFRRTRHSQTRIFT